MFVILGHTDKRETFVIGITSSKRYAEKYVESFPVLGTDEYAWVEVQRGDVLNTANIRDLIEHDNRDGLV